jgi:predicted DNA-binding protein
LFTLDLPRDIEKRLLVLAMHTGRTVQYCAREAIMDYIDEVGERFMAIDRIGEDEFREDYDSKE